MGNPYITEQMLGMQLADYKTDDAKKFVTVFAICIGVSTPFFFLICQIYIILSVDS